MMEPPAKRLRILQSVEVDEENEDYINAKKAQEKKFKGRMESIFAKYENMHESNSDIIDMKENKVVVDRGHLRRLQRQVTRNETSILDTLGLSASKEEAACTVEEEGDKDEESEDELAPTQRPKAAKTEVEGHPATVQPMQTPMISKVQPNPQQTSYTPGPAASLLQYVQFPQTPAGQQAQSAFYTTLTQTINQAVQQAVAPLFSGILSNTPNLQGSLAHVASPLYATPSLRTDTVTPAIDPKWFFPPLPVESPNAQIIKSTSLPTSSNVDTLDVTNRIVNETTFPTIQRKPSKPRLLEDMPPITHQHESAAHAAPLTTPSRRSPRVEIQRRRSRASTYQFSNDDDVHISKKKVLENCSWADIRDSREKWRTWPIRSFHNHWRSKLRHQNLHLHVGSHKTAQDDAQDSCAPSHHLPTPSSSRHEDHVDEPIGSCNTQGTNIKSSSLSHYDDEELELLSLAGDAQLDMSAMGDDDDDDELQEDVILPSIETAIGFVKEDTIQQDLLQNFSTIEPSSTVDKTGASNTMTVKRQRLSLNKQQNIPNTDANSEDRPEHTSIGISIHKLATTPGRRTIRRSTSIDLVGDEDELLAPMTPRIKRESSTPAAISWLCSTPAPKLRAGLPSSQSKSTSKVSQKMFRKQIKQSWTKMGTPGLKSVGKSLAKRKSFPILNRKRAWNGEESEDELAM